jgi:hypothetical protein
MKNIASRACALTHTMFISNYNVNTTALQLPRRHARACRGHPRRGGQKRFTALGDSAASLQKSPMVQALLSS